MSIELGIDIGYAENESSCGLAASVESGSQIRGWRAFGSKWTSERGRTTQATNLTLRELLPLLTTLVELNPGDMTIVIDGPLGPSGPPRSRRSVDRECQRGRFQYRAVPASVTGGGAELVDATYKVARALVGSETGPSYRFNSRRAPGGPRVQLFESMPTIGLAVLLPCIDDWSTIPSRSKPVKGVTAKSDFYWERGAGTHVARFLATEVVSSEPNHDRRAALYCLAVAMQVDGTAACGRPSCVGEPATGVYVLAGPEDPSWTRALDGVKRVQSA